jgi:hypothetical protein
MEVGLLIRYGKLVPGREEQAMELFGEVSKYYEEKVKEGILTYFEPFFLKTSDLEQDTGFFVLKGEAPQIFKLMEEEKHLWLMMKGEMLVQHLRVDLLTVGEGIFDQMGLNEKVRVELGV